MGTPGPDRSALEGWLLATALSRAETRLRWLPRRSTLCLPPWPPCSSLWSVCSLSWAPRITPARPGLTYGMTVSLKNKYEEFTQSDANGWVYLRASNGAWDHFDILSPLHREGPVSFGDQVLLRAHNTKLVSVRPGGGLEAVKQTPDLSCVFT